MGRTTSYHWEHSQPINRLRNRGRNNHSRHVRTCTRSLQLSLHLRLKSIPFKTPRISTAVHPLDLAFCRGDGYSQNNGLRIELDLVVEYHLLPDHWYLPTLEERSMCLLGKVIQCLLKCLSGLIQGTLDDTILCVAPCVDLITASAEKWSWRVLDGSFEQIADKFNHGSFCETQLTSRRFYV